VDAKQNNAENKKIDWEVFSEKTYEAAIKEGKNVIVFIEPSRFKESFFEEVNSFLENVNSF